jgi:lycopene cyclase domain-containing protein
MSTYTYLLLNLAIITFPLLLSFESRVAFYKSWKAVVVSIVIVSSLFIFWDNIFTRLGVWSFNSQYITGIHLIMSPKYFIDLKFHLPLEEILFFITVPYSCLFVYAVIEHYTKEKFLAPKFTRIWFSISLLCLVAGFWLWPLLYSSTVLILTSLLILLLIWKKPTLLLSHRFIIFTLITLTLFVIFNYILTSLPVVSYHPQEITNIRILTIPIEDFLYNFLMLTSYLIVFLKYREDNRLI